MEKILAVFESQLDSPKVIASSKSSKRIKVKEGLEVPTVAKSKEMHTTGPEYDLYITSSRFICAVVWDEESDVPEDSSLPYDILVQQIYTPSKERRRSTYKNSTPDDIVEMHPKSMSIPFDEVDWVKVKKGFFGAHVEISLSREEKPIRMPIDRKRYNEAKSILKDQFGSKLR